MLFEPIWMKKDLSGRQLDRAYKRFTAHCRKSDRYAALEKVADQKLLGLIAKRSRLELGHCRNALDRITEEGVLEDVALQASDPTARLSAALSIQGEEALCRVYEASSDDAVRAAAVKGLARVPRGTERLLKIALSSCGSKVFGAAFNAIQPVILDTKAEDAGQLPDDVVACMIKAIQSGGAGIQDWPTLSEKSIRLLKALYREGKHVSSIAALSGKQYRSHTDYHADCSCAQWGHEDVQYIFTPDDDK